MFWIGCGRQGPGYQTTINRILRERMQAEG
jgi:uncharacterized protein (DUF4415 family)